MLCVPIDRDAEPALMQEAESHCHPRTGTAASSNFARSIPVAPGRGIRPEQENGAQTIQNRWYPIGNDDLVRYAGACPNRFLPGLHWETSIHQ